MQRSNQCCAKKTMGKNTNKSNQAATRRRQRRRHDCPDALMSIASAMLLLIVAVAAVNAQMEQMSSSNLGSIATGSGRIFRPTRSTMMQEQAQEELTSETNADDAAAELAEQMTAALSKRSMSLGRLAYGPGKRRFLPVREEIWPRRSYASISGAFARDPLNRRYELLFMDNGGDDGQQTEQQQQDIGVGVPQKNELNLKQQQFTKLANHPMRFRLLPSSSMVNAAEDIVLPENNEIFEASMGKRSSLASGRIGFRPAKRSMAVGRTGFRPGKRSIATGRVRFRPGKRAMPTITNPEEEVYYLWL